MLKKITTNLLNQLQKAISTLDEKSYSQHIDILGNSSIGQHCRHILSFYECLIHTDTPEVVNYDHRKRLIEMETNPLIANMFIDSLKDKLETFTPPASFYLQGQYGEALNLNSFEIKTSLERELIANIEHTVHHMAIIRIALNYIQPDFILDESFGIASSTMRYQDSQRNE